MNGQWTEDTEEASNRIEIREAVAAGNEALLALTRASPMGGRIALRIDRGPDFFALPRARGAAVVLVAMHEQNVLGCLPAAIHRYDLSRHQPTVMLGRREIPFPPSCRMWSNPTHPHNCRTVEGSGDLSQGGPPRSF